MAVHPPLRRPRRLRDQLRAHGGQPARRDVRRRRDRDGARLRVDALPHPHRRTPAQPALPQPVAAPPAAPLPQRELLVRRDRPIRRPRAADTAGQERRTGFTDRAHRGRRARRRMKRAAATVALGALGVGVLGYTAVAPALAAAPRVLRVGSYHGIAGTYTSVQKAVLAAHAGDWVLVGPGDYKENGYAGEAEPAGVLITQDNLHLRGMDRNKVIIDGTKPGSPVCSNKKTDQIFTTEGRDGVQVLKADGSYLENFT